MANQLQATGAVKIRSLTGALTATGGVVTSVPLGSANGVATLDSLGKVPLSQLPASVVTYLGTWNAATNTPTLANGTGDVGDLYICNVAGTANFGAGPITFAVGDWVIYSGTTWQKSSGASGTVTSVAATVPTGLTVTGSPITTSGTLAFGLTAGYTIPLSTQLVPSGGTAGQLLAKNSATNYDTVWIDNYTEQLRDTVKAAVAINKGQAVYISGANGTNQIVSLASNASEATSSKTLGLAAQNFAINDIGQIITEGLLAGIDTSTATAGDPVWLGVDGNLIFGLTNKPVAPAHLVYIGVVTRVQAINGEIYVKVQNGFELQELHNILITSPLNNQGLFYNSSNYLWENKSIATALGYTPADDSLVVHLAGTETITGTKTFTATSTKFSKIRIDNTTLAQSDTIAFKQYASGSIGESGNTSLSAIGANQFNINFGGTKTIILDATNLTTDRTYLFPDSNGTVALTSDLSAYVTLATNQTITGFKTFSNTVTSNATIFLNDVGSLTNYVKVQNAGAFMDYRPSTIIMNDRQSVYTKTLTFKSNILTASYDIVLPDASGTVALTSNLTGFVSGTGTTNYLPKFTAASTIGNSLVYDNGTNVLVGTATAHSNNYKFGVYAGNYTGIEVRANTEASINLTTGTGTTTPFTEIFNSYGNFSIKQNNTDYSTFVLKYNGATNVTTFDTAGAEAMRINANRTVSIGNTNSTYNLDVTGTGRFQSGASSNPALVVNGNPSTTISGNAIRLAQFRYNTGDATGIDLGYDATAGNGVIAAGTSANGAGIDFWTYNGSAWANRMTLTKAGNLGIGTTSPDAKLKVIGTIYSDNNGLNNYALNSAGTNYGFIQNDAADKWSLGTGTSLNTLGTPVLTWTKAGNVGIGTTSPNYGGWGLTTSILSSTAAALEIASSRTTNGAAIGAIDFIQTGNTSNKEVAQISSVNSGTTSGNTGASLLFWTKPDNGGITERMRITSAGNVGIGTTSPVLTGTNRTTVDISGVSQSLLVLSTGTTWKSYFYNDGTNLSIANNGGYTMFDNGGERMRITNGGNVGINTSSPNYKLEVNVNGGNGSTAAIANMFGGSNIANQQALLYLGNTNTGMSAVVDGAGNPRNNLYAFANGAGVVLNSGATSWTSNSDETIKDIIEPINNAIEKISKFRVVVYKFKNEEDKRRLGLIAQDVEKTFPEIVSDSYSPFFDKNVKGVAYTELVPVLVKGIQEQQEIITNLQERILILEK